MKTTDTAEPTVTFQYNGMDWTGYFPDWNGTARPPYQIQVWPGISGGADDDDDSDDGDDTGGDKPDATGGDKPDAGKTFTQEEVNAIAARAADKAKRGKVDPKEFGFESQKDMKTAIDKMKQQEKDSQDEQTKALEEAKKEAADQARQEVLSVADQRILRAEFILAATKAEVAYPHDAFDLAKGLEAWSDVSVEDDHTVTGLDEALFEELKEKKPFLFKPEGEGGAGDVDAGAGGRGKSEADEEAKARELFPALGPQPAQAK